MKNRVIILLLTVVLFACRHHTEPGSEGIRIDFNDQNTSISPDSLIFKFVKLETKEECLIGPVSQVAIVDNRIFILDSYKNRGGYVFDLDGRYITKIGEVGNGPYKYLKPQSFSINEMDSIFTIADIAQSKLINYRLDNFQPVSRRFVDFAFSRYEALSKNNFFFYCFYGFSTADKKFYVLNTDSAFRVKNRFLEADFTSGYVIGASYRLYRYNNEIFVSPNYQGNVYKVDSANVSLKYTLSFGKKVLPPLEYLLEHSAGNKNYARKLSLSDYVCDYIVTENENTLTVVYISHYKDYVGLYNKQTQKTYNFRWHDFNRMIKVESMEYPVGSTSDYIICPINVAHLQKRKAMNVRFLPELQQLADQTTEEDNPILCLFSFK